MPPSTLRPNPKSYRPDQDDIDLARELMEFYGAKSEGQLISMAYRALRREMVALQDLYVRPAKTTNRGGNQQGRDSTSR